MSKQKEIREGIYRLVCDGVDNDIPPLMTATKIYNQLHSQKCRIEVDRELPATWSVTYSDPPTPSKAYEDGQSDAKTDMLKAGYVRVEPLVKEEK